METPKRDKIITNIIGNFLAKNQGIDEVKITKRAHQLHQFLAEWTDPKDLVCMAIMGHREMILRPLMDSSTIKADEMQDYLDEVVSGVLSLYALAESRMEADLERRERGLDNRRLDPERKLEEVKEEE